MRKGAGRREGTWEKISTNFLLLIILLIIQNRRIYHVKHSRIGKKHRPAHC